MKRYYVDPTSIVDENVTIGSGTRVWHFCHISEGVRIGKDCVLGQNVFVGRNVKIGDKVKIQNNVSVYEGVEIEDNVFCGPSCVFTNDKYPRAEFPLNRKYQRTIVRKGVTIGANATIISGLVLGKYSLIGAGAVVTKNVDDYTLVYGSPAKEHGKVTKERIPYIKDGQVEDMTESIVKRKYLITGTSSGIGRALAKSLVEQGNVVWGVARRRSLLSDLKKELDGSDNFIFSSLDISRPQAWKKLITLMKKNDYFPDVAIFNAAITASDFEKKFETSITKKIFAINFMGILEGVESLLGYLKEGAQLIAVSSSSSLKGSQVEGVGYAASKAALSIAFESLYLRFKKKYLFKTIYLGPVASGMGPFRKGVPFCLSEREVVKKISKAVESSQSVFYFPWILFLGLRFVKLLPNKLYFAVLSFIDGAHRKLT